MILNTAIYPRISLPLWLRLQIAFNRILSCATHSAGDEVPRSANLEREFLDMITRENATISRICFSYSGSVAEYDDLRQDALINLWRGMSTYRGDASQKTWIYRVTVNSCLSTIRQQSRHRHECLEGLYGLIADDDIDKETIEQMHQAIGRLGDQEKAIIIMWLDELSYEEIASAMGLKRNTVATKIRRIKDKITKEIKDL